MEGALRAKGKTANYTEAADDVSEPVCELLVVISSDAITPSSGVDRNRLPESTAQKLGREKSKSWRSCIEQHMSEIQLATESSRIK